MKRTFARLVLTALAVGVAAALPSLWLPFANFRGEAFVDIPKGSGTRAIARLLKRAGVVRFESQFLAARLLRPRATLQAGEYRFNRAAPAWEVFTRIAKGDVFYYELPVPEGRNMFDIAQSIEDLGLMKASEFLRAARNPAPIRDLAPEAATLEGYLFPSTYHLTRLMPAEQICRQMTGQFRRVWKELGAPAGAHRLVTLASLVEKETAAAGERPVIASVYRNRLALGMKLDCDPTTIYAALLENRYRGAIFQSDLASASRYNTYQHAGLPPGPIANPGKSALEAALAPAETKFLYFVARPDHTGTHQFSAGLDQHQRAVAQYRRGNRKANPARPAARVR
ncbi:MAG: endolytic transglycosylase MltG [Bryobacterales bacterium]|nr:endolytic transglycosylase MltG [Bryobacterales bacterium]